MASTTSPMPVKPRVTIEQQPESVRVAWSDNSETLVFNHSFTDQRLFYHRITAGNQALLKACSNKRHSIHTILDLTAGWGIDSFILAQHGRQVTMLEQNPLVHSVISRSLLDASQMSHTKTATQRIVLKPGNSIEYLQSLNKDEYDCIYLDPMFPEHKSHAKPGKEMQILQKLTENLDIDACFELALQKAGKRVVVKRPLRASPVSALKPDLNYREKTIRFDIYLTQG